jgi:hypothetical protein
MEVSSLFASLYLVNSLFIENMRHPAMPCGAAASGSHKQSNANCIKHPAHSKPDVSPRRIPVSFPLLPIASFSKVQATQLPESRFSHPFESNHGWHIPQPDPKGLRHVRR